LHAYGERLEPRFGRLGREYGQVVFAKEALRADATLEWVTPGHPLFDAVRAMTQDVAREDLQQGAVFFDVRRESPARLEVYSGEVRDGRGNVLHQRLFVAEVRADSSVRVRQPTVFLDIVPVPGPEAAKARVALPTWAAAPDRDAIEQVILRDGLTPVLAEVRADRERQVRTVSEHTEISLGALLNKAQLQFAELMAQKEGGSAEVGLDGRIRMTQDRLDELDRRLERRRTELRMERECAIANLQHLGSVWVLPHPDRRNPNVAVMVPDPEIEKIAVRAAIAFEEARGWQVQSVESENRGFDLISRRPHPDLPGQQAGGPHTGTAVRFIEVKGRAYRGEIALTANEYRTAERLKNDYWLYVVLNCATTPTVNPLQDPAHLEWQPVVKIEPYRLVTTSTTQPLELREDEPRYG
jgi:hypothetical protein